MGRELVLAAREGHTDALENLLSSNAPLAYEFEGESALVAAAAGAHVESVRVILKAGADPNRATRTGNTALRTAITLGDGDCIEALLEGRGASHSSGSPTCIIIIPILLIPTASTV